MIFLCVSTIKGMAQQNKSIGGNGARVSELEAELAVKAADAPTMDTAAGHTYKIRLRLK